MAKEKPKDVHIDLLETDMRTGAHWLSPAQKNQEKAKEIRERHRAKAKAKSKDNRK
jgi:conjugal transfer/entry exclusion protein